MTKERKQQDGQHVKKDRSISEKQQAMEQLSPEQLHKHIKKEKRKAVRSIVFALAALIALITICIAWFVRNTRVNGVLGGISANMKSVELRTYGDAGIHDDLLKKITETKPESFWYALGDKVNKLFETSSEKYAINWLLSDQSNMGNYSADQKNWEEYWKNPSQGVERQDRAIEPGSSGRLRFYIVPKYDGKVELKMDLSVIPYKAEGNQFEEIKESDKIEKDFIDGHILFFLEKGTNQKEIQWIKNGTFEIEIENAKKDQEYGYTLYWCWPQNFGEAVLNANDSYLNSRKPLFSEFTNGETMRDTILLSDDFSMIKKPERYFYSNLTKEPLSSNQKELKKIAEMYNKLVENFTEDAKNAFIELSSYYNQADQYIGSHVDCVRVRLTAE